MRLRIAKARRQPSKHFFLDVALALQVAAADLVMLARATGQALIYSIRMLPVAARASTERQQTTIAGQKTPAEALPQALTALARAAVRAAIGNAGIAHAHPQV